MRTEVAAALKYALNMGFQIHPAALQVLEGLKAEELDTVIRYAVKEKARRRDYLISRSDLEVLLGISRVERQGAELKILFDPTPKITGAEGVSGYVSMFASRFAKLRRIINQHQDAKKIRTAKTVGKSEGRDDQYICGLVLRKESRQDSIKLVLEDETGTVEVLVYDPGLRERAGMLLLDQLVMVVANRSRNGRFVVKRLVLPGVPNPASNRSETDVSVVLLSDLHIGSRFFMEDAFTRFVEWLSSSDVVARGVRFIIVGGDLVDGVGIYPNQDRELDLQTVEEQLGKAEELLSKIPSHIKVVIAPGNHDPGRRALPQPAMPRMYNEGLYSRENFFMVGNPCMVSLNGVRVLVFHGQSIDDVVKVTPGLSYGEPAGVMKHLVRIRHLCPVYGGTTPIAPEMEDFMVIEEVPDIFHAGHVHVLGGESYRGILLLNSGTFQSQTPFQASVGIKPTPGVAIVVNLKTFKADYVNFR